MGLLGLVARALAIAGLFAMTTVYVWCKVEASQVAQRIEAANRQLSHLAEDRSKLGAAVERSKLPGSLRHRAITELEMVEPESDEVVLR